MAKKGPKCGMAAGMPFSNNLPRHLIIIFHLIQLKGRFSSGLEGASAIKLFCDLTGEQPCTLNA